MFRLPHRTISTATGCGVTLVAAPARAPAPAPTPAPAPAPSPAPASLSLPPPPWCGAATSLRSAILMACSVFFVHMARIKKPSASPSKAAGAFTCTRTSEKRLRCLTTTARRTLHSSSRKWSTASEDRRPTSNMVTAWPFRLCDRLPIMNTPTKDASNSRATVDCCRGDGVVDAGSVSASWLPEPFTTDVAPSQRPVSSTCIRTETAMVVRGEVCKQQKCSSIWSRTHQ